jgi:hypothetical protein
MRQGPKMINQNGHREFPLENPWKIHWKIHMETRWNRGLELWDVMM